ncbi:MAG: prepilin-type N-terminal cleavage/methylation domain-containing protein [Planctomycetota bacterium]
MPEQHRRGFSLVELLVVIAVVALLVSVLLPALGAARRQGQLLQSVSNVRQITTAALAYAYDNSDTWPIWPVSINESRGWVRFNSWDAFGATTSEYWDGTSSERTAAEAPLNEYIYADLDLDDPSEDERLELPIFECPGDRATFQRAFWSTGVPDYELTGYDDVGTSYHQNVMWWYASAEAGERETERWARTKRMFRRAMFRKSSTFVWLYDQKFDIIAIKGDTLDGDHGGTNKATAAFMDGHCGYINVQPGEAYTDEYQLLFEPPKGPVEIPGD